MADNISAAGLSSTAGRQNLDLAIASSNPSARKAYLNAHRNDDKVVMNQDNYLDILQSRANNGDESALDYLLNFYMTEQSAKTAREWESKRYQTLVKDMKAAGLNPYWSTEGSFGAPQFSNTGSTYSGSNYLSARRAKESERNDLAKNITSASIPIISSIVSGIIMAALFL